MNPLSWQGMPPAFQQNKWHWLKPRGWKMPMPFYWNADQQHWHVHDKHVLPEQIMFTHEYLEPVTWAGVYDVNTNSWKIM
jgi:hypothetical protein